MVQIKIVVVVVVAVVDLKTLVIFVPRNVQFSFLESAPAQFPEKSIRISESGSLFTNVTRV